MQKNKLDKTQAWTLIICTAGFLGIMAFANWDAKDTKLWHLFVLVGLVIMMLVEVVRKALPVILEKETVRPQNINLYSDAKYHLSFNSYLWFVGVFVIIGLTILAAKFSHGRINVPLYVFYIPFFWATYLGSVFVDRVYRTLLINENVSKWTPVTVNKNSCWVSCVESGLLFRKKERYILSVATAGPVSDGINGKIKELDENSEEKFSYTSHYMDFIPDLESEGSITIYIDPADTEKYFIDTRPFFIRERKRASLF